MFAQPPGRALAGAQAALGVLAILGLMVRVLDQVVIWGPWSD